VRGSPKVGMFDFLTVLVVFFLIIALTETPKATPPAIQTLGQYAVTASWRPGSNDDVDLYVRDPNGNIAYFDAQDVGQMHLEHDDLGTGTTGTITLSNGHTVVSKPNGERTVINGIVPGEYIVNVQMYAKTDRTVTPVVVQLWELRGTDHLILSKTVTLARRGEQLTAFRFTLRSNGNACCFNDLPRNLVGKSNTTSTAISVNP
jgi:hypothetical protein